MLRRVVMVLCLCGFGLSVGCGGEAKVENPSNLEFSKDGPPKREGVQAAKKGGK
ncbi:MAG: hypothetical protein U0871_25825 [Gemmataceae bacterium]